MRTPVVGLFLSLATGSAALAATLAPVPPSQKPGYDTIREADLRADLGFIASSALQGRMSLQPGDAASIEWVAAEFAKAGLMPAAVDAKGKPTYLQPVPLIEYQSDSPNNFIQLSTGQSSRGRFLCVGSSQIGLGVIHTAGDSFWLRPG
jgi:hypothetical protein